MSRYDYDRDDDSYSGRGRDYGRERGGSYSEYDEGLARGRGYDYERDRDYYARRPERHDVLPDGLTGRRDERADYEREYGRPRGRDYDDRRDYGRGRDERRGASRSHVRCRDIMTRDVTVATRATTLGEVAKLMRDEDTGVIPVVEIDDTTLLEDKGRPSMRRAWRTACARTASSSASSPTATSWCALSPKART